MFLHLFWNECAEKPIILILSLLFLLWLRSLQRHAFLWTPWDVSKCFQSERESRSFGSWIRGPCGFSGPNAFGHRLEQVCFLVISVNVNFQGDLKNLHVNPGTNSFLDISPLDIQIQMNLSMGRVCSGIRVHEISELHRTEIFYRSCCFG